MIYDDSASEGGMITASNFRIDSFPLGNMAEIGPSVSNVRLSSGVAADHEISNVGGTGVWTGFAIDSNGVNMEVDPAPVSPQTAAALRITATSAGVIAAPNAMAIWGLDDQFSTTADSLLVVKAMINTTAADTDQIPTLRLTTIQRVGGPTEYTTFVINDFMLDRTLGFNTVDNPATTPPTVDSDVSTTIDDYYLIGETAGNGLLNTLWFTGLANQANQTWNGDLQLHELTITEHPIPLCGCD
jgi:hypothetical protein